MFAAGYASKSSCILFQLTPAKLIVDYQINSWNETHSKQQIIFKHKRKRMLKSNQDVQSSNTKVANNLARLRSYKENLLNSQVKKLSEKTLPTASPASNPSVGLTRRGKQFQFYIRSLSQSKQAKQDQKEQIIATSEFDCGVQEKPCGARRQAQSGNLIIGGPIIFPQCRGKTLSLPKPDRFRNRVVIPRVVNRSQTSIGLPINVGRPQLNAGGLMSRRLISSRQ